MTPEEVQRFFTSSDGTYRFARWGRPLAPVVFGVEDTTLSVVKGAVEAVVMLAGHKMAETDPELGANLMLFFLEDWEELRGVPDLDRLIGDIPALIGRLEGASSYRTFRFDDGGAIKACFSFVRIQGDLAEASAEAIALSLAVHSILFWSDGAFADRSALAIGENNGELLRPEIAGLIQAAYDPVMPVSANNPSHSLRLAARLGVHS